jgi:hypothetical protein
MINNPSTLIVLFALIALSFPFVIKNSVPYNVKDSSDYAYLAGLAYCPKKCLENWSCKSGEQFSGMVDLSHINNDITLASCYIGYNRPTNQIIISFRGSDNI